VHAEADIYGLRPSIKDIERLACGGAIQARRDVIVPRKLLAYGVTADIGHLKGEIPRQQSLRAIFQDCTYEWGSSFFCTDALAVGGAGRIPVDGKLSWSGGGTPTAMEPAAAKLFSALYVFACFTGKLVLLKERGR